MPMKPSDWGGGEGVDGHSSNLPMEGTLCHIYVEFAAVQLLAAALPLPSRSVAGIAGIASLPVPVIGSV